MRIELDVPLRGTRTYLHSTDIYRAFAETLKSEFDTDSCTSFRAKFNNFACTGIDAVFWPAGDDGPDDGNPNAFFWFGFADGRRFEGYFEENGKPIQKRVEGAEPEITALTEVTGESATTPVVAAADLIEHIVFATKALHNSLMPPAEGRWILVEFKFNRLLEARADEPVTIALKHSYEQRLTESEVLIGSENVGTVRFMVWA